MSQSKTFGTSICWLRRDLRLHDQVALAEACARSEKVLLAFIFDTTILSQLKDPADRRLTFIARSLEEIDRKANGSLLVRHGDPLQEIPKLFRETGAEALFYNRDYEPSAKARDLEVSRALENSGIRVHAFKDQVIFEGSEIQTKQKTIYRIFTPYKNAWLAKVAAGDIAERRPNLKRLAPQDFSQKHRREWSLEKLGFKESVLWIGPGPDAAQEAFKKFWPKSPAYDKGRDLPAIQGTSELSTHLRFGTISIRELVRRALPEKDVGTQIWLSELIWRDFFEMIMDQFPHVAKGSFHESFDRLPWSGKQSDFKAWCEGRTGYPIVDAGMRQLNSTGFMHNRVRMITATFLAKDLLVDWRLGEKYFAEKLLDYDAAANMGGWQWCASVGADCQPYFRIFNPITQSQKFDAEGEYIRKYCPELKGFSKKRIHWPAAASPGEQAVASCKVGRNYPAPIVDHDTQRKLALELYTGFRRTLSAQLSPD